MQLPEGKRLWTLLASLGGAIVTIAAASFVIFMSGSAANRLPDVPVSSLVFAFQKMNDDAWRSVAPVLPDIDIPSPSPVDGVLVKLPNGSMEWILLDALKRPQGSPAALALIGSSEESILDSLLIRSAPAETPWIAVTKDSLPLSSSLIRIDITPEISLSWQGPAMEDMAEPTIDSLDMKDVLSFQNPASVWEKLMVYVPNEREFLLKGLLKTAIQNRFGKSISAEHELLPLFSKSLTVWKANTGTVLLYGSNGETVSEETIATLHAHASEGMSGTERITAETKEGFTVDVIRKATGANAMKKSSAYGWEVTESFEGDIPVFITATRGRLLMVTNDRLLLEAAIGAEEQLTSSFLSGKISLASQTDLRSMLPSDAMTRFLNFGGGVKDFEFEVSENGGIWKLSFLNK